MKKTETALSAFIAAMAADQIRQLISRGACIGLRSGTDLVDFGVDDFRMTTAEGASQWAFTGGCFFTVDAMQLEEFEAGDLSPPAGDDEEDDGGDLHIYAERITDRCVERARANLMDEAAYLAENIQAKVDNVLNQQDQDRD